MKPLITSLMTLIFTCFVVHVSAEESSIANDELQELRTRVKLLEAEVQNLKYGKQADTTRNTNSLAAAIKRFNARSAKDQIGRTQPELTLSEVIAAIRWLQPDDVSVTAEEFAAFKKIAETQELPPEAKLEVISSFIPNDKFKFKAWSVRLRVPRSAMKGWTYAFPIRQRWISSAPLTDRSDGLKQLRGSTLDIILPPALEESLRLP
ncbi:MAG: hypothetical protein P1V19_12650 [Gimesia sp.]|nr:hypothetical protein [Gimesia sp.]